ncbi:hypothetical protein [Celerinatantimonas sp. MCCC 1A17872]|uniref:hypothetical protein n=1 Tax=Celerinatantimonas sp. MCCC 1A17872 TaxID=3177514 RepID=UPI0038C9654E
MPKLILEISGSSALILEDVIRKEVRELDTQADELSDSNLNDKLRPILRNTINELELVAHQFSSLAEGQS